MNLSLYLPPREEQLLDELCAQLEVSRNKAIRLAVTIAAESLRAATETGLSRQRMRELARS